MRSPAPAVASVLLSLLLLNACDAVDRARTRFATTETPVATATGSGLALGLQTPGVLSRGEEGVLRLTVVNRNDTTVSRVRVELIVPVWVEPLPPRPGEAEVAMMALDEGTRFAYRLDDTPLGAGDTWTLEQRVRVPAAGPLADGALPWSRTVRAHLLGAQGQVLAEVESEIALAGVADDTTSPERSAAPTDRLGPVRLGMTAASLRQSVPAARDTTWSSEGLPERGLVIPLQGGGSAVATIHEDTVSRIEIRDAAVRDRQRLGVGSTMGELRAAYGTPCADVGEGIVVVWFPRAPGVSFALDSPMPQNPAQLRQNPEQIPATARVTHWWIRRGVDRC
jgi:hypothetical protein